MLENALWMLILMALTAYVGMLLFKKQPKWVWFVVLVELALVCRFILIYVVYANGTEASGTDGLIYHQVAKDVANQLRTGTPIWGIKYEYTWYTVLVGLQYFVLGVNRYAASFINAFLAILSGFFLTGIAVNLKFSFKKSGLLGLAYLFMPSMMVWTTDTRKESITFFISILIWYMALRVLKERDWSNVRLGAYIAGICLLLWVSTLLRIYMLYTLGGGLLVGLFFHYLKTRRRLILYFGAAIMATCLIVTYCTVLSNMRDYHALPIDRSQGGDEDINEEVDSILKVIIQKNIPGSINGFLTKPHLENVPSITDIAGNYFAVTVVRLEMVLWYICMIFAIFGILDTILKWDPYLIGILAFIVSYSLINALVSENVGETYFRYRAAIVAPILLFADYRPFLSSLKGFITGKART
ncbi:MAG: hypothetical protein N2376_02105 [Clostridia bacterium]|nr:hypothetical protein [Clostridia bacterium]